MQPFQAKCLIWKVLGLRFCMLFANFSNEFFVLLSRRTFCAILAHLGFQRVSLLGSIFIVFADFAWNKRAEIEARKLMTFGRLLGGAGGSGEACLSLQILQGMASGPNHALLPLRGCGES